MVQVLQQRERQPGFLESLLGSAKNKMDEYSQGQAKQQALEREYALKGGLETQKQDAKFANQMKLQEEKQNYLNRLFGGSGSQSSNQQTSQRESQPSIQDITGNELPEGFNASKITDEDIARASSIDPNLGRALGHAKDVALRENREEIKATTKEKNRQREEELAFHKESQKYDEDLSEKTRRAKNQIETFTDIEKAINSGNVKPASWTNIFRNFGETGNRIANAIMNKDEATILSSIPQLLEGWKQVFGVRLTDADLRVLQDKLPDIGKSAESNKAILKIMKKYGDMTLLRSKIASDIKKQNKGLRPLGYTDRIEERFDEMTKPVKIINPKTGNPIEIPAYKVGDAINAGATLADE